ncbi:hypothetical protein [Xanthobacter sp.]|uniref:hypothetical protein n=1 Tax=Xanthobacter sp. TaxID=35809 RepID=UPI0035B3AE67
MVAKTISDQRDDERATLERLGGALETAQKELGRLWQLHEAKFGGEGEYLRDGAFTDAGLKRLRHFFGEGKKNVELARFFGVSDSAIAYQRKKWELQMANV